MITSNNKKKEEDLNASNSNIIYEALDFDRSIELIIFEEKDDKRFQLHLWNADTDQAMIIDLERRDLTFLVNALDPFCW